MTVCHRCGADRPHKIYSIAGDLLAVRCGVCAIDLLVTPTGHGAPYEQWPRGGWHDFMATRIAERSARRRRQS